MNDDAERHHQADKALDEEFRDVLRVIKPFILNIHDTKHLASYRMWLEKLSGVAGDEARLRNAYATELCRQIQAGVLQHPFLTVPPEGGLSPTFLEPLRLLNDDDDDDKDNNCNVDGGGNNSSWLNLTDETYTAHSLSTFCDLGTGDSSERNMLHELSFVRESSSPSPPPPPNDYLHVQRYKNVTNVIDNLKNEHCTLTHEVEECKKDLNLKNTKAETSIHKLTGEVNLLKSKVQGLFEAREIIQSGHRNETDQLQNVIYNLERKLHSCIMKNGDLKLHIATMQQKINELLSESRDKASIGKHNENLIKIHDAEITLLKQNHAKMLSDVENAYAQQIKEKVALSSQQTQEQKNDFETKYVELKMEYEKSLNEKDKEIFKLKQNMKEQDERIEKEMEKVKICKKCNENKDALVNKIRILQNCICRMHKLFKKSDKEYARIVNKLRLELELKEKKHKIELSTSRAELVSKINLQKQNDIDDAVTDLEKKYKTLLEKNYAQSLKEKDNFDTIVTTSQNRLENVQLSECNKAN